MVRRNVLLDGARLRGQLGVAEGAWRGSVVPMVVRGVPEGGRITVETPDGGVLRVPAADGVYSVGAVVPVMVADDGRALKADPPGVLPDGGEPVGVGVGGELVLKAHAEAVRAWESAKTARESIKAVDSSARAAREVADAAVEAARLNAEAVEAAKRAASESDAALREELARRADELAKLAQDALKAGQLAQASADGKALIAYSDTQPATVRGQKVIWFKPGGVPMLFDGAQWRSVQPGDGVVPAIDIGRATVGELSGMRIKAGTASVDILIMGENARWTSTGLTIYHPLSEDQKRTIRPTDWDKRAVALDLTSDGSRFLSVSNAVGDVTAFMAPSGEVSARSLMVTGEAQVDSLTVGGVALPDLIASSGFQTVGLTILPDLTHPAGVQLFDMFKTDTVTLQAGLYRVSWSVNYEITRAGVTALDASGAFLRAYTLTPSGDVLARWANGAERVEQWGSYFNGESYATSTPVGWLRVENEAAFKFIGGMHSYQKLKLAASPSALVIEKVPEGKEIGHYVSAPPSGVSATKPPAPVTRTVALREFSYAYGSEFIVNTGYSSSGVFDCSFAKGKRVTSIRVTGRSVVDFYDGGEGREFTFSMGGETRSVKIWDYSAFTIVFGADCASQISTYGRMRFVCNAAEVWNKYDPAAFRITITYQP